MKKFIISAIVLVSASMSAAVYADNSRTYSSSNTNMNNVQVNTQGNGQVSVDGTTCPTGSVTLGGAAMKTQDHYYDEDQNSGALTIGYSTPFDFSGVIDDCRASVAAKRHQVQVNLDMTIIRNCFSAQKMKIHLDPSVFPWARKCAGLIAGNSNYWKIMSEREARARMQRLLGGDHGNATKVSDVKPNAHNKGGNTSKASNSTHSTTNPVSSSEPQTPGVHDGNWHKDGWHWRAPK